MSGRKQGLAYELYGFIPKVLNGKHMAICIFCNRTLKNTAATRLHKHRNFCRISRRVSQEVSFTSLNNTDNKIFPKALTSVKLKENLKSNSKANAFKKDRTVDINDESGTSNSSDEITNNQLQNPVIKRSTDDNLKAKIQYYQQKIKYFQCELDNLRVSKTVMTLQMKKLRLKIDKLERNR